MVNEAIHADHINTVLSCFPERIYQQLHAIVEQLIASKLVFWFQETLQLWYKNVPNQYTWQTCTNKTTSHICHKFTCLTYVHTTYLICMSYIF
jgi:hypothetical protein